MKVFNATKFSMNSQQNPTNKENGIKTELHIMFFRLQNYDYN